MSDKKIIMGHDGMPRIVVKSEQSNKAQPENVDRAVEMQGGLASTAEEKRKITGSHIREFTLPGSISLIQAALA